MILEFDLCLQRTTQSLKEARKNEKSQGLEFGSFQSRLLFHEADKWNRVQFYLIIPIGNLSPFWKLEENLSVLRLNHHEVCGGYRHMSKWPTLVLWSIRWQSLMKWKSYFSSRSSHQKERETQGPPGLERAKVPLVTRFEEVTGQEGRVLLISISFKP